MTQTIMQERRSSGRFSIVASVEYGTIDCSLDKKTESCDVSLKGARLMMYEPIAYGKYVNLLFNLPADNGKFKARGEVIWQKKIKNEDGQQDSYLTGVCFYEIREFDKYTLFNYVHNYLRAELMTHWWSGIK